MERYKEYKNSGIDWIGEIPKNWNVIQLRYLISLIKNGTSCAQIDKETNYKVSRIETISTGKINLNKVGYVSYSTELEKYKLKKGDLLFSNINSLEHVGKCAIYKGGFDLYSGMNLFRISPKKNINAYWLYYTILDNYFVNKVKSIAKHAINQVSVSTQSIKEIHVAVPSLPELKLIASYLNYKTSQIDSLISDKEKLIKLLKEQRQSIISEAVTKGIDKTVPMKDSDIEWIGKIPEHWKIKKLKYLANIRNGQDYKNIEIEKNGIPVYGSGGRFAFSSKFIHNKSSVLLGRKGTIDKPIFVEEPFWTVDTMYYTNIFENTEPKYLYFLATTIRFDFFQYGSAVPSMTQKDLSNVEFAVPKRSEQKEIVVYIETQTTKIDNIIEDTKRQIELLKEYRQSIISEAVTGKFKVPQEV